jgi:hypothetical protein
VAADSKGSSSGMYVNAPVLGQSGALVGDPDTAVGFGGTNQSVNVPYSAALNPSVFSVEAWANVTGGSGTWRTVLASRSYPNGFTIYASSNNTWQLWLGGPSGMQALSGGRITSGWHHLVGTYDGTSERFYVDGILQASGQWAFAPNGSQSLTIGMNDGGSSFPFTGSIDEVAVYNTALSPTTIQHHYNLGLGNQGPSAITGSASNVTQNSATVSATINPYGQATTYHFDYGPTQNYGSQAPTPDTSAGSGTSDQAVSANLTALTPGTTYHYRITATNPSGTTYGPDQTLTTAK